VTFTLDNLDNPRYTLLVDKARTFEDSLVDMISRDNNNYLFRTSHEEAERAASRLGKDLFVIVVCGDEIDLTYVKRICVYSTVMAVCEESMAETAVRSGAQSVLLRNYIAPPANPNIRLSKRQLEIVRLVSRGFSNIEIGLKLHIDDTTVKTHLRRVFRETQTTCRGGLTAFAMRNGLIS